MLKLKYKHSLSNPEEISRELKECAESIAVNDERMQLIKNKIYGESIQPKKKREDFEGKL